MADQDYSGHTPASQIRIPVKIEPCADPYDPWMTDIGVAVRRRFYDGALTGKLGAVVIAGLDWLMPGLLRSAIGATRHHYPITVAQQIMLDPGADPAANLDLLLSLSVPDRDRFGRAWGLGFNWMSKNGLYGPEVPFVTHTPYAMEALLALATEPTVSDRALAAFAETRRFLDALIVQHEDNQTLALSYAPIDEPRIVTNANAYACYAYAMHSQQALPEAASALGRALALARFVVQQQEASGAWYYYADREPGNFIDCFHTCFVLKNLIKAGRLVPEIASLCEPAIARGRQYLDQAFFDQNTGLVRRFTERDIKDPFVWDLYDQAEYIGLLVLQDDHAAASALAERCRERFQRNDRWACKIDFLGRRWGYGFLRWGIVPYWHATAGLD